MTDPSPITSCLSQAGSFRTAARLEIRTDGYFMEDVRELARSARGIAAPFAHPRLVSLGEFATTRAMTDAANAQTQWTVAEPAPIQQDMSTSNVNQQAPQPTNSWFNRPPPAPPTHGPPPLQIPTTRPAHARNTTQAPCPHRPLRPTNTYDRSRLKEGLRFLGTWDTQPTLAIRTTAMHHHHPRIAQEALVRTTGLAYQTQLKTPPASRINNAPRQHCPT